MRLNPLMLGTAGLALAVSLAAAAEAQRARPVRIGARGADGCEGVVRLTGPGPRDGGRILVRAAPAPGARVVDRARPGSEVLLCDRAGSWIGIVYPGPRPGDCGTDSPLRTSPVYRGPCRSGWVTMHQIEPISEMAE